MDFRNPQVSTTVPPEGRTPRHPQRLDRVKPEWVVRRVSIEDHIQEFSALSALAYQESGFADSYSYLPDWDELYKFIVGGKVEFVAAYYKQTMIGYALALIGPYKHNHTIEYASLETVYIHPNFRDIEISRVLMREIETALKGKVSFIAFGSELKYQKLFQRWGYEPAEITYIKRLDNENSESTSSTSAGD